MTEKSNGWWEGRQAELRYNFMCLYDDQTPDLQEKLADMFADIIVRVEKIEATLSKGLAEDG